MTTNWICGLRRLAWVLTLPLAALATLALNGVTKETSVEYDRDAIKSWYLGILPVPKIAIPTEINGEESKEVFETIDVGALKYTLSSEDFARQVKRVTDALEYERQGILNSEERTNLAVWRLQHLPDRAELEIRIVRVDRWKLLGLAVACLVGSIVLLQGSVLAFGWVAQGFSAKCYGTM